MPPRRAIKKVKIKTQTFLHPYQFRPVAISLRPADIEIDMEIMNTLLVAQRAALQRAFLEQGAAAAPVAVQHAAAAASDSHAFDGSDVVDCTSDDEHDVQQQQQHPPAPANKLASPSCTFQHQKAFGQQQLTGYAVA